MTAMVEETKNTSKKFDLHSSCLSGGKFTAGRMEFLLLRCDNGNGRFHVEGTPLAQIQRSRMRIAHSEVELLLLNVGR